MDGNNFRKTHLNRPCGIGLAGLLLRFMGCMLWLAGNVNCRAESPAEIYQLRIMPLLASETNSCSECHLQGIDLKSVLSNDPAESFADLRARGWIDVDNPEKSKFLAFIERHSDHSTDLQRRVRQAELQALSAWIVAACKDSTLLKQPVVRRSDLDVDEELIRHGRVDQVTRRFTIAIWSQLERCANCHSPDRNQKQVEEHGEQMSWIVPQDPKLTLELLTERKLIDFDFPENSILRSKPTGRVEHGAGTKFPEGGQTDQAWLAFLNDYVKTVRDEYDNAEDLPKLPAVHSWRSGLHLRIVDLPEPWANQIVNVTLHHILPTGQMQSEPSANAECYVTKDRLHWSNSLILLDQRDTIPDDDLEKPIAIEEALPAGNYQLRMTKAQAANAKGDSNVTMTTTIAAPWQSGHQSAAVIQFNELQPAQK